MNNKNSVYRKDIFTQTVNGAPPQKLKGECSRNKIHIEPNLLLFTELNITILKSYSFIRYRSFIRGTRRFRLITGLYGDTFQSKLQLLEYNTVIAVLDSERYLIVIQ